MHLLAVKVRSRSWRPAAWNPSPTASAPAGSATLFPTWVAANMTVLLLTVGAGLVVFSGLNSGRC